MMLLLFLIIFLFSLYVFSKDDFVLLRKNVTQNTIFDFAFLTGIVGLFFSRLVYVLSHFSPLFLNPLVFFVIPYFPGLSFAGLLLGGAATVYLLAIRKKVPVGRVFDIFSFALLITSTISFLENAVVHVLHKAYLVAGAYGILTILLCSTYVVAHGIFIKSSWKDGKISLLLLSVIALAAIIGEEVRMQFQSVNGEVPYFLVFLIFLLISFLYQKFRKV